MLERYFYGGYNATTTIFLAVMMNIGAILIKMLAGAMLLPFLALAAFLLLFVILWGLIAAAKNPENATTGRVMCGLVAIIQLGWIGLHILPWFV